MSALFSKPSTPAVPVAPPPPNLSNSQTAIDAATMEQARSMQRGRSATMLTGGAGLADMGSTSKTLLGQ
jgi:hypothetical protein